jgi:ribose 5-phosphate isomerase B
MYLKRIFIGSDHAGWKLKGILAKWLAEERYDVKDMGPILYDPDDDYPDYAVRVCRKVLEERSKGLLICGSGMGMDRAANKIHGIHASVCWNLESARQAKKHGNINVLCLGEKFVKPELAKRIVKIWLEEPFEEERRHVRRIQKIREIERRTMR